MTHPETSVGDKRVTALVGLEYKDHDTCFVQSKDEPYYLGSSLAQADGKLSKGEIAVELVWATNLMKGRRLARLTGTAVFTDGTWATFRMADVAEPGDEKLEFNWVHIEY